MINYNQLQEYNMSDNDFNIYLVSNVSTDIFPNNGPAEFSTILAEDIRLETGEWEVAVRNIIYPSNIASTTEDDKIEIYKYKDKYRNLYPQLEREEYDENESSGHIYEVKIPASSSVGSSLGQTILKSINDDLVSKKFDKVMKFELRESNQSSKFILHIYVNDFFAFLNPQLADYLGFKSGAPLMKGSHWAWSAFNPGARPPDKADRTIFMNDLQSQNQEQCTFVRSFVQFPNEENEKGKDEILYTSNVYLKFRDNKDDELLSEPKMRITVEPQKGTITLIRNNQDIPSHIASYERKIRCITFDETITKTLKLQPIYYHSDFTKNVMTFRFPKVAAKTLVNVKRFKCIIYFEGLRELNSDVTNIPIDTIKVESKKNLKKPLDYLELLNTSATKKHGIKFTFNDDEQRFYLETGPDVFVRLTKSLSAILGFSNLKNQEAYPASINRAGDFPVMDRSITSLYIYSNIVQNVFIGNVKASLLLTCPFNKNSNANVTQLEFLNPTYTKLNRSTIHQIDIAIYDEAGAIIPFLHGKTVLTLTFRKYKNF